MRGSLSEEPGARPRSIAELMGLAAAMEAEAVARYGQLAREMERQGETALAVTFRAMLEEERRHGQQVTAWSMEATGAAPPAAAWELPADIARSWDEVAGSALLTPYRALAVAVLNEERGFAYYAYIAAHAADARIRSAAERLAAEELGHAAALRRLRRRAYRRAHPGLRPAFSSAIEPDDFSRQIGTAEAKAAAIHYRIAARLAALGDSESAALLEPIAAAERHAASGLPGAAPAVSDVAAATSPAPLLREALAASERLHDVYADALEHADSDSLQAAAERGATRVAHDLALIAARLHAPR